MLTEQAILSLGRRPKKSKNIDVSDTLKTEIVQFYREHTLNETCAKFGMSWERTRRIIGPAIRAKRCRYASNVVNSVLSLYDNGESFKSIARKTGLHSNTVRWLVLRSGRQYDAIPTGENHWNWKGGKCITRDGYVMCTISPEHPYASMARNKSGHSLQILEHRLVMAQLLGRALLPEESVHHISGDRADNRPENLELRSGAHGKGVILRCRDCNSNDIEAISIGGNRGDNVGTPTIDLHDLGSTVMYDTTNTNGAVVHAG